MNRPFEDAPDTGRLNLRRIAAEGTPSERVFADQLERLLESHQEERGAAKERARWAWVWRAVGTIAFSVATGLGGYVFTRTTQVDRDHDELVRLAADVRDNEAHADATTEETRDRLEALVTASARIEVIVQRVEARMDVIEERAARERR